MEIRVDTSRCDLCKTCIKTCKFNAITFENNKIIINESCKFCNKCVKDCPQHAISISNGAKAFKQIPQHNDIILIVDDISDSSGKNTLELIAFAYKLKQTYDHQIKLLCFNKNVDLFINLGLDEIFTIDNASPQSLELMRKSAYLIASKQKVNVVLLSSNAIGRAIAPHLAISLDTGLTADCTDLKFDEHANLTQIRPAFGDNILASIITPFSRPQIATVRPASISPYNLMTQQKTKLSPLNYKFKENYEILKSTLLEEINDFSKTKRCLILGNALKSKDDLQLFKDLALKYNLTLLSSRALVDRKIFTHEYQVGLSGMSLRADFALLLGVSGSSQFLSGIKQIKTIVAINNDKNANIFNYANYGVICDIYSITKELLA